MKRVVPLLLIAVFFPLRLCAQRTTATISGIITDPSGAVVPQAKVIATNTATQAVTSVQATSGGFYVVPNLQPGPYRLDVAIPGFQSFEQTGIVLQVGQELTVNVSLRLGSATEKVTVTAQAPLVNTRDQTLSTAITPQFTEQLPLNGRDILQLMAVAPDTSEHYSTYLQYASRPEATEALYTGSGESRGDSTTFYLDGGLNMDTYTPVANVFPNPDAVQEFTYDTNSYSAKYGGLGGGVVNAVTRGGSNKFHGSAFEYVRNGDMNARNFFAADQDTLKRNQFGGSVGGPIQKDKTFGFFSFQKTTLRYGTTANVAFGPTAAELSGDWSAVGHQLYNTRLTPDSGSPTATSTFTTDPTLMKPFPNNQVDPSLYSPLALKVLALVPAGDPITGKITYVSHQLQNDPQYVARVDRNFGEKLRISGSLLKDVYQMPLLEDPNNALTAGAAANWPSWHAALNISYSLGPNLMTTVGGSLSRALIAYTGTHKFPTTVGLGANFPNWLPSDEAETGGYFGWFGWGVDDHYDVGRNQYDFTNGWTYMRGSHMLEFGGEFTLSQSILNQDFWGNGYTGSWCGFSGYSPLDFLLGQNCYYEQYGSLYDEARGKTPALYLNDKWKVKRGLTWNLGLRWDPWRFWPDHSAANMGMNVNQAAFAAGTKSTKFPNLPPGFLVRGDPGVANTLVPSDWRLFEPRAGVAWDVRGNGKTSVRLGFGFYHDQPFGEWYNQMLTSFPFVAASVITDPTVPWYSPYNSAPYNGQLLSGAPPTSSTVFPLPLSYAIGFTPAFKPQGSAQWNLTVEHQLGQGFLLRTAYEGSQSWHIPDDVDINSALYVPGTNPDGTPKSTSDNVTQRRPWYLNGSGYGGPVMLNESTNLSSYDVLSISVEKRMTGNFSMLGGYRWGKCMDRMTSFVTVSAMEFSDSQNKNLDRGICNSDIASQIKMAVVYRLPTFRSSGFAARNILGGWAMSGIWTWRDGFPFGISGYIDSNLDGYSGDRAAVVGNPRLSGGRSEAVKLQEWFNTAAFTNPPVGSPAASARNILRGPGFFNLDYSLIRSFPIRSGPFKETQKIDFRAEFFNIFNHPNFNGPDTGLGDLQFGEVLSARDPRILQFALKYIF